MEVDISGGIGDGGNCKKRKFRKPRVGLLGAKGRWR